MKLFSAVVLSLLFCFVKSFKSRAIRGQLKNVSAHGQAMRAGALVHNPKIEIEELIRKMDTLREKVGERNADATSVDVDKLDDEIGRAVFETGRLSAEVEKMKESPEKAVLDSKLDDLAAKVKGVEENIKEKKYQTCTAEVKQIKEDTETWIPKVKLDENVKKQWLKAQLRLEHLANITQDEYLNFKDEERWKALHDEVLQVLRPYEKAAQEQLEREERAEQKRAKQLEKP
eukprot:Platyproteum_vivax@DN7625_c1_g1_i16.p1